MPNPGPFALARVWVPGGLEEGANEPYRAHARARKIVAFFPGCSPFAVCLVGARFSGVINFHARVQCAAPGATWCRMRFAVGGTAIRFRSPGQRRPARVPPLEPTFICHGRSSLR
ncbi:hypothetical protein HPB50_004595 [Hyalomma asiaticum]|uniref:Uncharacterized protein n=1 Tax=Hyalomma asiaticum TaxID=266040 RepID=A0ACB7TCC0_HYAAI|nr:hypothetical protein HPB50_004595 [Hyalomma asiaticum]